MNHQGPEGGRVLIFGSGESLSEDEIRQRKNRGLEDDMNNEDPWDELNAEQEDNLDIVGSQTDDTDSSGAGARPPMPAVLRELIDKLQYQPEVMMRRDQGLIGLLQPYLEPWQKELLIVGGRLI